MDSKSSLQNKILGHGGSVVHLTNDSFVEAIEERGVEFDNANAVCVGGYDYSSSDENSLDFCSQNDNLRLCTGLTLNSDSGVWINHSWCMDSNNKIYECTPIIRNKYVGIVLNQMELEQFIDNMKSSKKKHL